MALCKIGEVHYLRASGTYSQCAGHAHVDSPNLQASEEREKALEV